MDVVEDEHHLVALLTQLGEQGRHDLEPLRTPVVERQDRLVTQRRDGRPERRRDVPPEPLRRSVVRIDGQPRNAAVSRAPTHWATATVFP